jgi:hypothetical protein
VDVRRKRVLAIAAIAASFAVIGSALRFGTDAATHAVAGEAEAGAVSGNASVISGSAASAGQAVQFGGLARSATPFSPTSFWNLPLPADVPLHADSDRYASNIASQVTKYYGNATVNVYQYTPAIYTVGADVPTVAVKYDDCQNKGYVPADLLSQWTAVPIPSYALPADGTDKELVIYQPSTDTIWEFWVASKRSDGWYACWGGKLSDVSASNGIWPVPFGTTATGLPFQGGIITIPELQAGVINHVIGISLVEIRAAVQSYPANRNDGRVNDPDAIAEGQRFRLDPAFDVDASSLTPTGKTIARAAQKYGFVVWDTAGSVGLRAENPMSRTGQGQPDPYPALFDGKAEWQVLQNFPWSRLQALPFDYGKP